MLSCSKINENFGSWSREHLLTVTVALMTSLCWLLKIGDMFRDWKSVTNISSLLVKNKVVSKTFRLLRPSPTSIGSFLSNA